MTARTDSREGGVRIVADGRFGAEVAEHLAALLRVDGRGVQVAPGPLGAGLADFLAGGELCVRASWRDIDAEFAEFADAAMTARRAFVPVAFAHPYVRVGPAIAAGLAPCHGCYSIRARQFADAEDSVNDECERALGRDPRLGVSGHPPHVAAMAAGLVLGMLTPPGAPGAPVRAGRLVRIDCGTDEVRTWPVVSVHGCPVCGPVADHEAWAKVRRDRLRGLVRPATGDARGEEGQR
jgi:bacteriocin biosynthesis cyclodehydratase domain-containing protein